MSMLDTGRVRITVIIDTDEDEPQAAQDLILAVHRLVEDQGWTASECVTAHREVSDWLSMYVEWDPDK